MFGGQVFHHGGQGVPGGTSNPHRPQGPRARGAAAHHTQGLPAFPRLIAPLSFLSCSLGLIPEPSNPAFPP